LLTLGGIVISGFYELSLVFSGRPPLGFSGLLSLTVVLLGVSTTVLVPGIRYRFWSFELTPDELRLVRGVLTRVYTLVPLRRIQHLDVAQNILEREFDLGKLVVYTAGTQGNRIVLPGLPIEEARDLRDRIKEYILEDAV
jgi:membrane protein YdbS with pleckstrin-like domain